MSGIVNNKLKLINLILKADLGPIEFLPLRPSEEGLEFNIIRFKLLLSGFAYQANFVVYSDTPTAVSVALASETSRQDDEEEAKMQERLRAVIRNR